MSRPDDKANILGEGTFGIVCKFGKDNYGNPQCIKLFKQCNDDGERGMQPPEITDEYLKLSAYLKSLNQNSKLIDYPVDGPYGPLAIVMPLAWGSATKMMNKNAPEITTRLCWRFAVDVFSALVSLKMLKIAHCDITPNNILVFYCPTIGWYFRLGDFGNAKSYAEIKDDVLENVPHDPCTTVIFEVPEFFTSFTYAPDKSFDNHLQKGPRTIAEHIQLDLWAAAVSLLCFAKTNLTIAYSLRERTEKMVFENNYTSLVDCIFTHFPEHFKSYDFQSLILLASTLLVANTKKRILSLDGALRWAKKQNEMLQLI
tara:strand:- start:1925 stop:2866 length:942 start_codon:yes stop_codon:yes gene_type:complete